MTANYIIESRTKDGKYLATLQYRDLQGEFYYSKTQEIRFSMSLSSLNQLTHNEIYPAKTEIIVYRDGVKVFCGPLWDLNISSKEQKVNAVAQDISSYFERRDIKTKTQYSGILGDTAWALINESQGRTNGNLYITRGSTVGGSAPTASYTTTIGKYLDETLNDLYDGSNGFDWVITPNRVYNQFYPRINSRANERLEFGANVKSYSFQIQGKYIGNSVRTLGSNKVLSSSVVDTTSQTTYGLMEYVESMTSTDSDAILLARSNQVLNDRRNPKNVPTLVLNSELINPFLGDVTYGQTIPVVINDGFTQYDRDMRNVGFQLTVGRHGEETFTLYMNEL